MKYKFVIMYLGDIITQYSCEDYNKAQMYFYHEFFKDDQAVLVFIDGKEMNIFDAYEYFDIKRLSIRYGLVPVSNKKLIKGDK